MVLALGAGAARAQSIDAASAFVGSPFGGIRGSVDATSPSPSLNGFEPPPTPASPPAEPETVAQPPRPPAVRALPDRVHLPKLTNAALPSTQPVGLVALQPYPRKPRRAGGPTLNEVPNTDDAVLPVPLRRSLPPPETDAFAPIGYAVGAVRLFPYLQQGIGYDSNPEQISTGSRASAYSRTEGGLSVKSDWNGQELRGTMYGAYDVFFRNPAANRPDANGVIDYSISATRDATLDAEMRFNVDTQRPGSPEVNVNVEGRPIFASYGGTLGATQSFGRFSVGLHGLIDRNVYEDGMLSNGVTIPLAYQNLTDYGGKLRFGYDLKPGFAPFVEIGGDTRIHDDRVDIFGFRRDSDGVGARVGSSFAIGSQLTGTASAGYADRFYEDPRLRNLAGPVVDGSLVWTATPLTTLTLTGATSFSETNLPNASGVESRIVGLTLSHALFRYLTLTGAIIYQNDSYDGVDLVQNTLTESLKAEYHLSRWLVLTGTLSHQTLTATIPTFGYSQSVALLGVKVQH